MDSETPLTMKNCAGKSEGLRIRELEKRVAALERRLNFLLAPGVVYRATTDPEDLDCVRRMDEIGHLVPLPPEPKPATFVEAWQWMLDGGVVRQRGYLYKIEDGVLFYSVRAGSWRQEEKVYPETFLFGDWTLLPREGV